MFDRINGHWMRTQTLPQVYGSLVVDNRVALRIDNQTEPGDIESFYTRDSAGQFTLRQSLLTDESFIHHRSVGVSVHGNRAFTATEGRSFNENETREQGGVATIFRRESPTRFRHEATLMPSDAHLLPIPSLLLQRGVTGVSVSGERVAGIWATPHDLSDQSATAIYVFHVPQSLPEPMRIEDTFENGNAANWTPQGPANWRVLSSGGSFVFRQLSTQGDVRAILGDSEATHQSIQADMKIRSGAGPAPWAGLMVRHTNPQNFYYLLVNSKSIQIRRIVNGVFEPVASVPFSLVLGRNYRFRLEAIGKRLRVYRDGELVAEALDQSHTHGQAGLIMWKAATDYDNVIVTSNPYTTLHQDSFSATHEESQTPWTVEPANAWSRVTTSSGATIFRQSVAEGDARAVIGGPAVDQIVTAHITPRTFHASGTGWVGLMARYVDNRNYYYVVLRGGVKASLRKWVNGVVTVLEEVPMNIQANTTYRVRFEVIGESLRLYINGNLIAEGRDSDLPAGRYGLVTYRAAADFDTFSSKRP